MKSIPYDVDGGNVVPPSSTAIVLSSPSNHDTSGTNLSWKGSGSSKRSTTKVSTTSDTVEVTVSTVRKDPSLSSSLTSRRHVDIQKVPTDIEEKCDDMPLPNEIPRFIYTCTKYSTTTTKESVSEETNENNHQHHTMSSSSQDTVTKISLFQRLLCRRRRRRRRHRYHELPVGSPTTVDVPPQHPPKNINGIDDDHEWDDDDHHHHMIRILQQLMNQNNLDESEHSELLGGGMTLVSL